MRRPTLFLHPSLVAAAIAAVGNEADVLATQPIPKDYLFELPDQVACGEWDPGVFKIAPAYGRAARRDANRNRFRSRK